MAALLCYAPSDQADREKKDKFYQLLRDQINSVSSRGILIVIEDINANKHLLDFCRETNLIIIGAGAVTRREISTINMEVT